MSWWFDYWSLVMQVYSIAFIVLVVLPIDSWSNQVHSIKVWIHFHCPFKLVKVLVLMLESSFHQVHSSYKSLFINTKPLNVIQFILCSFHYKSVHVHTRITFWPKFATLNLWSTIDFLANQLTKVNWPSLDPLRHVFIPLSMFHYQMHVSFDVFITKRLGSCLGQTNKWTTIWTKKPGPGPG